MLQRRDPQLELSPGTGKGTLSSFPFYLSLYACQVLHVMAHYMNTLLSSLFIKIKRYEGSGYRFLA